MCAAKKVLAGLSAMSYTNRKLKYCAKKLTEYFNWSFQSGRMKAGFAI
jgi:hypothetical protein